MRLRSHSKFAFDKLPPELRVQIHSFLKDDRRTLVNAIRVNKEWFHQLIDYLWHEPERDALLCPAKQGGRRQFYADKIRTLTLDCAIDDFDNDLLLHWRSVLSTCETPYLEDLRVERYETPPDYILCSLLRPSLLSVRLSFELGASVIKSLGLCTRLRHLEVKEDVLVPSLESFMNLVDKLPGLSSIELGGNIFSNSATLTNKIFARLLKHGRLRWLNLGKGLSESDAQEISKLMDETLPGNEDLSFLSIGGHHDALNIFLMNTTTSLRTLEIALLKEYEESDHFICDDILRFTNLTELSLYMWPD